MKTALASPTTGIVVLLSVLLGYLVVTYILAYRKLRHIQGPWLASFSQLWLFRATVKGNLYLSLGDVLEKYGSPARIGPNMLITDDPEFIKAINAPRSAFRRGHWYSAMKFDPRINNLLSEQDEKRHAELRSKMLPGYTGKEAPHMEENIDARVIDFMNLIQREAVDKDSAIDFAVITQYFTLDSLTHIAFGSPFGFLTKNEDLYDYNKSSTDFFPVMELGTNIPFVHSILSSRFMQALAGPKPEDRKGFGAIIGIAQKLVAERFNKQSESKQEDMLNSFIKHGLSQVEAESESLLQILAGSDSTATSIRMTFAYILTNPPVYAKLRAEVDEAIRDGRVSYPVVQYKEAQQLPYLQACIKEGFRIWQPLNGIGTKMSPNEEIILNGTRIPPRTQIGNSQHHMFRRKDLFGPDASLFRPDRWLRNSEELTVRERIWDLGFSSGKTTCPGKSIALTELSKVFVELFRRFDFALVNPVKTMDTKCYAIHIQRNMNIQVWAREQNSNKAS